MSAGTAAVGRGASKRRSKQAREQRRRALRAWTRPGVLVFLLAVGLAAVGWGLVYRASRRIPVREATVDGLHLRLEQARWILDQMDHGENYQKPSVMMPDMPEWGKQRVTLELALDNRSAGTRIFRGEEFFLVPEIGDEAPPIAAQVGMAPIGPGQAFNTALHFDFDATEPHGKLRVAWRRGGEAVYLPVPEPAEHYHLRPRDGEISLPPDARLLLPIGVAQRGASLYTSVYGCAACHGDIGVPGSNNVGPHLGSIGRDAAGRIEGVSAAQYIYQSIRDPGAFIAPECRNGQPCPEPTAMPEYASLIPLQDFADLLTFLLARRGTEPPQPQPPLDVRAPGQREGAVSRQSSRRPAVEAPPTKE